MVDTYYELSTDFYEYGWGDSFHFAHRYPGETQDAAIVRHEHNLAARLGLKEGMKVLDVGCGVGGPARNIARFAGCNVTGLTINHYQISRAQKKTMDQGLSHLVRFQQGDFMKPPFADGSFDAAYAIEATCHAPKRTVCFSEVARVLKPGGVFGGYEWVMTDNYDPNNNMHNSIKAGIEIGDGLPDITDGNSVLQSLRDAGLVIDEWRDLAQETPVPWYEPFKPNYTSLNGIGATPLGIWVTHVFLVVGEFLGLVSKGSVTMHTHLVTASKTLRAGGELNIFTPMFYFRAHKPTADEAARIAAASASNGSLSNGVASAASSSSSAEEEEEESAHVPSSLAPSRARARDRSVGKTVPARR